MGAKSRVSRQPNRSSSDINPTKSRNKFKKTMQCIKNAKNYFTRNMCGVNFVTMNKMPSARCLPVIGTTLSLLAAGGPPKLHQYINARHQQLGSIFKEKIGPVEAVFVSDPNLMRLAFANEGKYPKHVLPEAWTLYNQLYNKKRGIFFMDGEEWLHFRRKLNKHLLKSENTWITNCCENSAGNLVEKFKSQTILEHLEEDLYGNSIETIISVLLGDEYSKKQSFLEPQMKGVTSAVSSIFETTSKLMLLPASLAYKLNLASWRNFVQSANRCLHLANGLMETIMETCPMGSNGNGLLYKMQQDDLQEEDIKRIIIDFILAAGDTTAYSTQWILYLLAKHEQIQENLQQDIQKHGSKSDLLKGVIKEGLRLFPVAPFLTRILPQDIILGGYLLPKNTLLIFSLYTSSRDPKNFEDPLRFWPERWTRRGVNGNGGYLAGNPYASLPFAMGARSCIGKKIADSQMSAVLTQLVNNFKMKLEDEEEKVEMVLRMVSVPSRPIRIRIEKR